MLFFDIIGCDSAIRASSIAFALHDNYSTRVQYPKWTIKSYTFLKLLFYLSCFIFSANYLNINHFETWNILLQCFTFSFNVSCKKHNGSDWSLPLCFDIAPTVFWNRSLSVFVFLPQCFWNETLKLKMKHKYAMFHFLKALIISTFKSKSETWKQK